MILSNASSGLLLQTMLYLANQTTENVDALYEYSTNKTDINDVRCYGVYGCFPINGPWLTNTRTVNYFPEKPSEIDTRFPVFRQSFVDLPRYIDLNDPESVKHIGIQPKENIYVLAHGYLEAGDRPWIREMLRALLDKDVEASVIVVDWGGGSNPPYAQAVANIRLVGSITAHVLHLVYEELKMENLQKVHMIGHSLGAHLSGYAGYTLQKDFDLTIGRITALDPAEPLFEDTEPIVRLDQTDAQFVDVIHTDANLFMKGGLGMDKPIGHVDFYPNGGHDNPGCDASFEEYMSNKQKASFFWSMQQFLGCNHIRSYEYFIESIHPKCPFKAITCDSYESFKAGNCFQCDKFDKMCLQFGYDSYRSYRYLLENGAVHDHNPIQAYLMTNHQTPYCQVHYKITIKISSSDESRIHGGEIGILYLKFHNEHYTETQKIPFTKEAELFEPGHVYTAVVPGKDIKEPVYATAFWEYQTNLLNPLTWRIVESPRLYIEQIFIENMEYGTKMRVCPYTAQPVVSGNMNPFRVEYCDTVDLLNQSNDSY